MKSGIILVMSMEMLDGQHVARSISWSKKEIKNHLCKDTFIGQIPNLVITHPMVKKNPSDLGLDDLSLDFHTYSMIWNRSIIKVMIDDKVLVQLSNTNNNPFDNSHYLLLNLAMGGALGGNIPENFEEDQMEIDFVRIYQ